MGNVCLWDPESGKTKLLGDGQNCWNWNQEYGIPMIGIKNPSFIDRD